MNPTVAMSLAEWLKIIGWVLGWLVPVKAAVHADRANTEQKRRLWIGVASVSILGLVGAATVFLARRQLRYPNLDYYAAYKKAAELSTQTGKRYWIRQYDKAATRAIDERVFEQAIALLDSRWQ